METATQYVDRIQATAVMQRVAKLEALRLKECYTYEAIWRLRWLHFARSPS